MKNIKVVKAEYLSDYWINIEFSNGFRNSVDLKEELWGKIFEPLNDQNYFKNFKLNPFTIYWENGADFSPEFFMNLQRDRNYYLRIKINYYSNR